jgi:parvin
MATTPTSPKERETFLDKLGTIARKKKGKEAQELEAEGKNAIESPVSPSMPDLPPETFLLEDGEERSMIEPQSREDEKLKELMTKLTDWVNDVLADKRIIVKNLEEDLYDGLILQKLIENLASVQIRELPEVIQSESGQKQKLKAVLDMIHRCLNLPPNWNQVRWSVDRIHSKNLVAILHLLVAIARHYRAPIRLPENCCINVVVVQKRDGLLQTRQVIEEITSKNDDLGSRADRDAFDTLFDHAPDKLNVVKRSLINFVNKHLNKINLEVSDLDTQFHDGVYLVLLMGLLEGYFVPLYSFHLTPTKFEEKVHNVAFSFELMQDAGLPKPKPRPEDIANLDLKSTLRVLYNLFTKYKAIS